MYAEMFEGMNYTNDEIADMFCKTFEEESEFCESDQDMVVVRDIEIFSHCEHHLALMYDMSVTVAYVPAGRVIGLSKIARIADMVSRRLQLQERIGAEPSPTIVQKITRSRGRRCADQRQTQLYERQRHQKSRRQDLYVHTSRQISRRSSADVPHPAISLNDTISAVKIAFKNHQPPADTVKRKETPV